MLKLKVSFSDQERDVIAGIAKDYKPEELEGKKVVMLLNLKPKKIMGHMSQGMILAAEHNGRLSVLVPDKDLLPGSLIS